MKSGSTETDTHRHTRKKRGRVCAGTIAHNCVLCRCCLRSARCARRARGPRQRGPRRRADHWERVPHACARRSDRARRPQPAALPSRGGCRTTREPHKQLGTGADAPGRPDASERHDGALGAEPLAGGLLPVATNCLVQEAGPARQKYGCAEFVSQLPSSCVEDVWREQLAAIRRRDDVSERSMAKMSGEKLFVNSVQETNVQLSNHRIEIVMTTTVSRNGWGVGSTSERLSPSTPTSAQRDVLGTG